MGITLAMTITTKAETVRYVQVTLIAPAYTSAPYRRVACTVMVDTRSLLLLALGPHMFPTILLRDTTVLATFSQVSCAPTMRGDN